MKQIFFVNVNLFAKKSFFKLFIYLIYDIFKPRNFIFREIETGVGVVALHLGF